MQLNDNEHYDLFTKQPKLTDTTTALGSENSRMYKNFVPVPRNICFLTEYFVHEEKKRRGFTSRFLTINPFENDFSEYVLMCEDRDKDLPASVAHSRLLSELEGFHKRALASLK